MKVYFDNAATTPMAPEIIEHMSEVMRKNFGNPSSVHEFGRKSKILRKLCLQMISRKVRVKM